MAQSQGITSFCIVVLAIFSFMINSGELKPQNGPEIRRLVEIKTVDAQGVVKARVVAEYESTESEVQKTSSENAGGAKRYQDDDEDSMGSGDSETNGESAYDMDMVAHDAPVNPSANQSSSEGSGFLSQSQRSSNGTLKPVDSNSSTVTPTGQNTSTTSPSTTTNITMTTAIPQTTSPMTTAGAKATVITGNQNVTTLSTLSPSTKDTRKNLTTFLPKVTEVKTTSSLTTTAAPIPTKVTRTTESNVTENKPSEASATTRSNFTNHGGNGNENITVSSTKASTSVTQSPDVDVKGQKDPEKKARRKTLFGFVTVEILIALLAGALFSVLLVAFLVYRLKKRNEGSYELSETIALRPKEMDEIGKKKEVFV